MTKPKQLHTVFPFFFVILTKATGATRRGARSIFHYYRTNALISASPGAGGRRRAAQQT